MPPNNSRSTGALRIAFISCCGVACLRQPDQLRASARQRDLLGCARNMPPPFEISALS